MNLHTVQVWISSVLHRRKPRYLSPSSTPSMEGVEDGLKYRGMRRCSVVTSSKLTSRNCFAIWPKILHFEMYGILTDFHNMRHILENYNLYMLSLSSSTTFYWKHLIKMSAHDLPFYTNFREVSVNNRPPAGSCGL